MRHYAKRPVQKRTLLIHVTARSLRYELRDKSGVIEIGNKSLQPIDSTRSYMKARKLLQRVRPHAVILPNTRLKTCRLGERSKDLVRKIRRYCRTKGIALSHGMDANSGVRKR